MSETAAPTTIAEFNARYGTKRVTYQTLNSILDALQDALVKAVKAQQAQIRTLETKIKELETKPLLKYAGIWQSGKTYGEGRLVTHGGSLWLAVETTADTPGNEASGYRLIVKRGTA